MSLLRDIQTDAVGPDVSVTVLLRQCLVLAARLQNDELREWATLELNGYPADADLPDYRPTLHTQVLGDFSGPFQSGATNQGLASGPVPEDLRKRLFSIEMRDSVAAIESLVASGDPSFQVSWPMDVVAALQEDFMTNMNLVGARQIVPASAFHGVLNGIRTRIVQFALEIEAINPDAGEAEPGQQPVEPSQVTQIFNQTFYGDNTAIATGGRDAIQSGNLQITQDLVGETLDAFGISAGDRGVLLEALEEENVFAGGKPGEKSRRWLQRLEEGAIAVGTGVSTQTAVIALARLLGLSE